VCYDGQGSITPIISSICFERRSCSSARFIAGTKCFRSEVIRACENGLANFCCKKRKGKMAGWLLLVLLVLSIRTLSTFLFQSVSRGCVRLVRFQVC
jgi:hypothetical protein